LEFIREKKLATICNTVDMNKEHLMKVDLKNTIKLG
jgi:hypothetical protein